MCLILEIPPNADPLSPDEFDDVARRNKDGMAVLSRAGSVHYRGLDYDAARRATVGQTDIIVHWRHATHGVVGVPNCHGWRVGTARVLHNGVLPGRWGDRARSDTRHLVDALRRAQIDVATDDGFALLAAIAGDSVIVTVGADGPRWTRLPATTWRGRWYSNRYAWTPTVHGMPPPPPPPPLRRGKYATRDDYYSLFWELP